MEKTMTIRKLRRDEVTFTLEALDEDHGPEDSFDAKEHADTIVDIRRRAADGDRWAWFCARVTASWNGIEAHDVLGGCSYDSEEDFLRDECFDDMCDRALWILNEEVARLDALVEPLREPEAAQASS
jgi:hypothetical protein